MTTEHDIREILDVCIKAGQIMMANGAETYRVEDTLIRMAKSYGLMDAEVFAVPTMINMSVRDEDGSVSTQMGRVSDRDTNFMPIIRVNQLSRSLSNDPIPPVEAMEELANIIDHPYGFNTLQRIIGIAIACGSFSYLFGGSLMDIIPGTISGFIGMAVNDLLSRRISTTFINEAISSTVIAFVAYALIRLGIGENLHLAILGGIMGLAPGGAITNSFRDLLSGDILSGLSQGVKALLTAGAIGVGVVIILNFI